MAQKDCATCWGRDADRRDYPCRECSGTTFSLWHPAADLSLKPDIKPDIKPTMPGGSTPAQYGLPADATDLQDLIEHRAMNFAVGNIFKACYRLGTCEHSDALRDMRKIAWFAEREIKRLEKST